MNTNVSLKKRPNNKAVRCYKGTSDKTKQTEPLIDNDDFEDDDAIEDAYFMKILKERENEPTIPLDEYLVILNAKMQKT